mmetsp:Transcript_130662/g.377993  ORF Transcript_130662/g.377993 Transcript_130662/m.377993 type:complete len:354 (-) Transcript_130662:25-1086(-)
MAAGTGLARGDASELRKRARRQLKEAMVARDSEDIEPLRVAIEVACEVGLDERDIARARELLAKLEAKDRSLALTDVSRDDLERLKAASSREEAEGILIRCMGLSLHDGFQTEVLAEFHYHNFLFTQSQRLNAEQASTFLSLMRHLHERAILQEAMSEAAARELFDDLVRRHSRQLPPFSIAAFQEEQAEAIRAYAERGFFKHFRMYAHVYKQLPVLAVTAVEKPLVPEVPAIQPLHKDFEVDPQEVLELRDLFPEIEESADEGAADAALTSSAGRLHSHSATSRSSGGAARGAGSFGSGGSGAVSGASARGHSAGSARPVDSTTKAEVEAAIDSVLQELLPPLDARISQLPE